MPLPRLRPALRVIKIKTAERSLYFRASDADEFERWQDALEDSKTKVMARSSIQAPGDDSEAEPEELSERGLELVQQYEEDESEEHETLRAQLSEEFSKQLCEGSDACGEEEWNVGGVLDCFRDRLVELLDLVDELLYCPEPQQHIIVFYVCCFHSSLGTALTRLCARQALYAGP